MTTHLIIPDAHTKPGNCTERFSWLGKLIVDRRPDKIICLGDFADMESLCSYDKGKKSFEGRSYRADIDAAYDAMRVLMEPVKEFNSARAARHKKTYKPEMHFLMGNHENRINRVRELQRELSCTISTDDFKFQDFGWCVYDFNVPVEIDGVVYSHYFTSGNSDRPIAGERAAAQLVNKNMHSSVQGHSHLFDYFERATVLGRKIKGLVAGCFLDIDQFEDYAGQSNNRWWRGVIMLHNVRGGDYSLEQIDIHLLKRLYGGVN